MSGTAGRCGDVAGAARGAEEGVGGQEGRLMDLRNNEKWRIAGQQAFTVIGGVRRA